MGEQPQTCIHRKNSIFLKENRGGGERKDFWNVPSAPRGGTKHMSIKSHLILFLHRGIAHCSLSPTLYKVHCGCPSFPRLFLRPFAGHCGISFSMLFIIYKLFKIYLKGCGSNIRIIANLHLDRHTKKLSARKNTDYHYHFNTA